jgi:hypothetical protein
MISAFSTIVVSAAVLLLVTLSCWVFLSRYFRGILVVQRFFDDSASGRELMRQAGNPPQITELEEPVLRTRIVAIKSIARWAKRLFIGFSLITIARAVHLSLSPAPDVQRFQTVILTAAAFQIGTAGVVVGLFYWAQQKVLNALKQDRE